MKLSPRHGEPVPALALCDRPRRMQKVFASCPVGYNIFTFPLQKSLLQPLPKLWTKLSEPVPPPALSHLDVGISEKWLTHPKIPKQRSVR